MSVRTVTYTLLTIVMLVLFGFGVHTPPVPGSAGISVHPYFASLIALLITGPLLALLVYAKEYKDDGSTGSWVGGATPWVTPMFICGIVSSYSLGALVSLLITFL